MKSLLYSFDRVSCHHKKWRDCWTFIDFDDTKTFMLWLLIKRIKCFTDYINIPKWFFTNEHLEQFFGVQIRIRQSNPSKLKQFKLKWRKRFESLKGGFESHFQRVQTKEGDSNPLKEDSNLDSRMCKLKNLKTMIQSLWKGFESQF